MKKQMLEVFNLEFPAHCEAFTIGEYKFSRIEDYKNSVLSLSCVGDSFHEYQFKHKTGKHSVTANVEWTGKRLSSALSTDHEKRATSSLDDALLLLSLFTRRDVFARTWKVEEECIIADPRQHVGGGLLRCSIPYRGSKHTNLKARYDQGFVDELNEIYRLVRTPDWQQKYGKGAFLAIAANAFKRIPHHTRFTLSWTIWEHLFAVLNEPWLPREQIMKIHAVDKIAFILVHFNLKPAGGIAGNTKLNSTANIRNRLVHFGIPPDSQTLNEEIALFLELTEMVLASTLNLKPSNILNTSERLEKFIGKTAASKPVKVPTAKGPSEKSTIKEN